MKLVCLATLPFLVLGFHNLQTGQNRPSLTALQASLSSSAITTKSRRAQYRDTVIVGGGLAGLSAALYLSQIDPTRHITILDKECGKEKPPKKSTVVGSFAAAGMLAPQSERLPKGDYLDLCMESRSMFSDFCDMVESLARESGEDGKPYLYESNEKDDGNKLEPWSVGFVGTGGFLAPAFAGDSVATWAPPDESGSAVWLDAIQVRELEPNLHPDVVGGWWFPEDASVDARRLTCSLRAACVGAGVQVLGGKGYEITSLDLADGMCKGMWLQSGKYIGAKTVLIANGSWMRNLLPVPIVPHKGQSLSLRVPQSESPLLRRVLFAQDSYIVPKADGRIIVGATVEAGSFDGDVTPGGLLHIISHALQLLPALKDLPIEETWAGLRPTTPDKGPILGRTPWKNLFLAGGYWRNGVLLAPKTGQLVATLMADQEISASDSRFLEAFAWDRFTSKEKSTALAANSRYAASMHPIHRRKTGTGVSASVGTELGSYSSARSAREERMRDRDGLWNGDGDDSAFERAAALGQRDAAAYTFGEKPKRIEDANSSPDDENAPESSTFPFEGTPDAYTVGISDSIVPRIVEASDSKPKNTKVLDIDKSESNGATPLTEVYKQIQANKAKQQKQNNASDQSEAEDRTDPGFRIFHKDSETGQIREVPPYTSPGDFLKSIAKAETMEVEPTNAEGSTSTSTTSSSAATASGDYNEQTYDGYQAILEANSSSDRSQELEAMRAARQRNRLGQNELDWGQIGAMKMDGNDASQQ